MDNNKLLNLIEKSKELSERQFKVFLKDILNIEEDTFEHLWKIPIISAYQGDTIISQEAYEELSEEEMDDLLGEIDECIDNEIGDSEAVFIPYDTLTTGLEEENIGTIEEINEKYGKLLVQDYDAIIVYNEKKLKENYDNLEKDNGASSDTDELFIYDTAQIFNHERCHFNANVMLGTIKNDKTLTINGAEYFTEEDLEVKEKKKEETAESKDNKSPKKEKEDDEDLLRKERVEYENYNEVCIDTTSLIIRYYKPGRDIKDCLYNIMKSRNGETRYGDFDDRLVLSLFSMYPEQMTKWMILGAYDYQYTGFVKEKINEMFPNGAPNPRYLSQREILLNGIGEYYNNVFLNENVENREKIRTARLLEMLDISNIKNLISNNINEDKIKEEKVISEYPSIVDEVSINQIDKEER